MSIRYDTKLNNEIQRTVRNFNNKIRRLERSERDLILPDRVSIKELKKTYTSRRELRNKLASLQRFNIRGVENTITTEGGVKTSIYELKETQRALRKAKSYLTRYIRKIENIVPTTYGVRESASYSRMGNMQLNNLRARRKILDKNLGKLTQEGLMKLKEKIDFELFRKNEMPSIFMNNYVDKMLFNLGYFVGYDEEKLNIMKNKLMQLDEKQFNELFETEEGIRAIVEFYPEVHRGNYNRVKDDISEKFDALFDNLDSILADYI